jgi:tRNA-(ms[2]io[6]A)-hydroxylase
MDQVLVDHAHCEKKAAASALSLVSSYPTHETLVRRLSSLAIEELRHFRAVHRLLQQRGLTLGRDLGDPYARALHAELRANGAERMVDRLLVAGLIEARSCERLELLAGALEDEVLARFYATLARAEAGHARLFTSLAESIAGVETDEVRLRLRELAECEARIVAELPVCARIH